MNLIQPLWKFVRDGIVGLLITTLSFGILSITLGSRAGLYSSQKTFITELFRFYGLMFSFQDSFRSPLPSVMLIGFFSLGIGGRFLEKIRSRRGWIKPILMISLVSWALAIGSFILLDIKITWNILAVTSFAAAAGFMIASILSALFNPFKRLFRLIIGAIASTVVSCVVGFWIYIFQIP